MKSTQLNSRKSHFGETFITLWSDVQKNLTQSLGKFRSFSIQLESFRPKPSGDKKCVMMKKPSRAKYYTGDEKKVTRKVL